MSLVKLSLASMTPTEKLQFARLIANNLEIHADTFPEPPRSFEEIRDASDELQASYNLAQMARQDAMERTTIQDNDSDALDLMLAQTANYVQSVSGGEASIIELVGMGVRNTASPVGELPAPANFVVVAGQNGGRITLRWEKLRGARVYVAEHTTDLAASWTRAGAVTRTKLALEGLTSAARYWFRVAAVGAAGQGAWSEALAKVAP
jgi:hypothetical protein